MHTETGANWIGYSPTAVPTPLLQVKLGPQLDKKPMLSQDTHRLPCLHRCRLELGSERREGKLRTVEPKKQERHSSAAF